MSEKVNRQLLKESCAWLREHWNVTNLEVPERLRARWIYETSDDCPEGFHLAVFTFGYVQYDMVSNSLPAGVKREYSAQRLLSLFSHWQLKLALAEVHENTPFCTRALPLFSFPDNEQVEFWCDRDFPKTSPT